MDNFEVFYDRDKPNADRQESVIVRRVARSRYSELKSLLSKLMANFLYFGCSRGELCDASNDRVWSDIKKVAEMLPLDGGGKLDLDRIDDIQILEIFFTDEVVEVRGRVKEQLDEEGIERFKPGKVTALHGFNFLDYHERCRGIYGIALDTASEWIEEDKKEKEKPETNGKVQEPELVELVTPMPS